jgi:hypothetical protein
MRSRFVTRTLAGAAFAAASLGCGPTGVLAARLGPEETALRAAERVIRHHHLLTAAELRCSTLVYRDDAPAGRAGVGVLERHGDGCPGDPDTQPRRFDLEIDLRTGAARWDNNLDIEMRPVPTVARPRR